MVSPSSEDAVHGLQAADAERFRTFAGRLARRHRWIFAALALLLLAYHLVTILTFGAATVDRTTYFLIGDDMMISMQYGRNLAAGAGLVYNPGERVEGFTNPLVTLVAAALHLLPVPLPILPLFLNLMNAGLSLGILFMLLRFWGTGPSRLVGSVFAGLLYVILPNHIFHAHAGFEVYFISAILVFTVRRLETLSVAGALMLGLLPLCHATTMDLWLVLIAAVLWINRKAPRRGVALAAAAVLPFVAYEILRMLYYGEFVPNTFWLKVGAGTFAGGTSYVGAWLLSAMPLVFCALFSLRGPRDGRLLLIAVLAAVHVTTVILLGGDIFPQYRFLFPISVLLAAPAGKGVASLLEAATVLPRPLSGDAACYAVCALVCLSLPFSECAPTARLCGQMRTWHARHIAMGLALRDNTPPGSTVGLFGLGYAGYYSGRVVVDMLGKADPHIARVTPNPVRPVGHNKTDFDYVMRRAPDFLECGATPKELASPARLLEASTGRWGHTAELGMHPGFRRIYMPHPALDNAGGFLLFYAKSADLTRKTWVVSDAVYPR
jgi:hypothetical protein